MSAVQWGDHAKDAAELSASLGVETPEQKIGRLMAETDRLRAEKLEWKRRALAAERDLPLAWRRGFYAGWDSRVDYRVRPNPYSERGEQS